MEMTVEATPAASERLERPFSVDRFTIRTERCLNMWRREAGCMACADACPVTAVSLTNNDIQLNESACVRCGVCIRACPTEVFVEASSPETRLVEEIGQKKGSVVELACSLAVETAVSRKPRIESKLPQSNCYATPRCLGAVSTADLLSLSQMGKRPVWLNDLSCRRCPISSAQTQFQTTVHEANEWLAHYGIEPALHTYTEDKPEGEPIWRPIELAPPHSARRSFFRKVLGLDSRNGATAVTATHIPQERQRLLTLLGQMNQQPGAYNTIGLPITHVQIDEGGCSACGLCPKFCPTSALRFVTDEEIFGLLFSAGACVDCGMCALVCPETAVSYHSQLPGESLLAKRPSRLVAGLLHECPGCRALIAQSSIHAKCFICRQQQSRPAFLMTR